MARFDMTKSLGFSLALFLLAAGAVGAEPASFEALDKEYVDQIRPLIAKSCLECHSTESQEGELDLERFARVTDIRQATKVWLKVVEMLDNGEMPPKDADPLPAEQKKQLRGWIERYLNAEAHASAGDPGPVVLRRLSNTQYTYTIQDLTGVGLNPLREFPADSAAGEGFTNTGSALVMSPSLLTKYFDVGKQIAGHAVLLPSGFRFSAGDSPRDWSEEILVQIRQTYRNHADPLDSTKVNLHGLTWDTNEGGRLPLEKYFNALLTEREALAAGTQSIENLASTRGLSPKYLGSLWKLLNDAGPSQLLDVVRARWRQAKPDSAAAIASEIGLWQKALTKFQSVGHMKSWMAPVNPLASRQEIRLKLPSNAEGNVITIYLAAADAGDGAEHDFLLWQRPRFVAPGRPDLLLRDVRDFARDMTARRERILSATAKALAAADESLASTTKIDPAALAKRHDVEPEALSAWLDYLGINSAAAIQLDHFTQRIDKSGDYDFVKGWGTQATPLLVANASDRHVRIPGNAKPHGVMVHPSPTLATAVGWKSPLAGTVRIEGKVTPAHPECGNGVTWSLELRRGSTRRALAGGVAAGADAPAIGPIEKLVVQPGDLLSLAVGPRDGNHSCDLTDLELIIKDTAKEEQTWSLTRDVSSDIHAGNPHADRFGHADVWHFFTEPVKAADGTRMIPEGSLLARWQSAVNPDEKRQLAEEIRSLLLGKSPADPKHPDALLYRQLTSLGGPLVAAARAHSPARSQNAASDQPQEAWGLDAAQFGRHPQGEALDAESLCQQAPNVIAVRLPADLVADAEFVTTATLEAKTGAEGSVQPIVSLEKPASLTTLRPDALVLTGETSAARNRFTAAFEQFRAWFPAALCYSRIVPVDEVVTLTLYHREDEALCRLLLDDAQKADLDRLWNELHFVSHDALTLVDAFAQLMEYATQDGDPKLFEPFRKPINDRAAAFRRELIDAEPRQLEALVDFAARAYRRPLAVTESDELRQLYRKLREQELPHDEALRFTLARVFVSPEFLYRLEKAPSGTKSAAVSDWELANRLSYFLWSSIPDTRLQELAASGQLHDPDVLAIEARRMLGDARVRRMAIEFACQWLHIFDFDTLDEKSESHFPEFVQLRTDMYEESIRFFTDLFQRDASVLEIFNADYTFVNEPLAKLYGIPNVTGPEWRRVDGVGKYGRGGVLGLSTTLAKQSGASRTSPILRGNWVSEVLLGEKLPRPPKEVPRLPEDETATEGLTVRQLVEKHSSDPRCSSCHVRVDPIGFALEGFDPIGRLREKDLAGRPIDTHAKMQDGTQFEGLPGLRDYLLGARRDAILRQFCRKLLGYALGRSVQLSDEPLLEEMQTQLANNQFRFFVAVETIVRSPQFREIRGRDAQFAENK